MKKLYLLAAVITIGFSSCKLDPNWDVDVLAPIAQTTLTPANMIPAGEVIPDSTGKLHYLFDDVVYEGIMDSLFVLPDTTYTYGFVSPANLTIQPGISLDVFEGYINPQINAASVTELIVRSGGMQVGLVSYAPRPIIIQFIIPKATKDGQVFTLTRNMDAAPAGGSITLNESIDLSGYHLDLTGDNGTIGNRVKIKIVATIDPSAQPFPISVGSPLVNCNFKLVDLKPYYAKGTIKKQEITYNSGNMKLAVMEMVKSGTVNLEDISMKISIVNGIGADFQATVYDVYGTNGYNGNEVHLSHPSINSSINVNRAQSRIFQDPPYIPANKEILINSGNSNLKAFVENLSAYLNIKAKFVVNPYGNVSGGNDFIFYNSVAQLRLKVEAPLAFSISDLLLVDTVAFNGASLKKNNPVKSGKLKIYTENKFPLECNIRLFAMDDLGNLVWSMPVAETLAPGLAQPDGRVYQPTSSILSVSLSESEFSALTNASKIYFQVKFQTSPTNQLMNIYEDYSLGVKVVAEVKAGI